MKDRARPTRVRHLPALFVAGSLAVAAALLSPAPAVAEPAVAGPAIAGGVVVGTPSTFSDIQGDEWYAEAAYGLATRTVMVRNSDGSFGPDAPVTRAQMAYFLVRTMGLAESPGQPFFDVGPYDWFAGSVGALFQNRIMSGINPLVFAPDRIMSKQDAVALLVHALSQTREGEPSIEIALRSAGQETERWLGGIRDRLLIDPADTASVAKAYHLGILDSPAEGWFFPTGNLTKAEMTVMLYRAFLQPLAPRTAYPSELPAAEKYDSLSVGSEGPLVAYLQSRLTALHYPCGPVDGKYSSKTRDAVMAFQKVERLSRTGKVNAQVWERLATASVPVPRKTDTGTRCEVDLKRQVLFMITDNRVTKVIHVSTGRKGTRTGHFSIGDKYKGWVECVTLDGRMYYPSYVVSKTAIHGYPSVPSYPASHGCIRVPVWTAEELFYELPTGTVVDVYY